MAQVTSSIDSGSATTVVHPQEPTTSHPPAEQAVRLILKKPKNRKKVNWTEETVDNEGMNKKKSKCCCIYKKPHVFGESSSESDDECENCYGHCEMKKSNNPPPPPPSVPPVS